MEKREINILLLSVLMLLAVLLMPVGVRVSAETETDTAPTVMYKLINHDCIKLKWDEITGADGYYIYRTDTGTGKTVKYKKLVTDTEFTVKGLKADTDYSIYIAPVFGKQIGHKSTSIMITTPSVWYYNIDTNEKDVYWYRLSDISVFRKHFDNSSKEKFDFIEFFNLLEENYPHDIEKYHIDFVYNIRGNNYIITKGYTDSHSINCLWKMNEEETQLILKCSSRNIDDILINNGNSVYVLTSSNNDDGDDIEYFIYYNGQQIDPYAIATTFCSWIPYKDNIIFSVINMYEKNGNYSAIKRYDPKTKEISTLYTTESQEGSFLNPVYYDDIHDYLYYFEIGPKDQLYSIYNLLKIDLKSKCKKPKIIKKYCLYNNTNITNIDNGYIYLENSFTNTYYCISLNGYYFEKQNTPFEWYY